MMGRPEYQLVKLLAMLEILPMRTASINRNTVKVLSETDHKVIYTIKAAVRFSHGSPEGMP